MLRTLYEVCGFVLVASFVTAIAYFSFGAILVYGVITYINALEVSENNSWSVAILAQVIAIVLIVLLATGKIILGG